MKKITTLFAMLLLTGGILMAQSKINVPSNLNEPITEEVVPTAKFNYQIVLRDNTNKLVANQSGTVEVTVNNVKLWVANDGAFTTNMNGMASILLADTSNSIDWVNTTIVAQFHLGTGTEEVIQVVTPVTAVPFAIQAQNAEISTAMITHYLDPNITNGFDVDRIYQALKANPAVHDAIRDSVVKYIKANYAIAKDIAYDYMHQVTAQDVKDAYDSVNTLDQSVKDAIYDIIKRYLKNHPNLGMEMAEYYISTAQVSELEELYNTLESNTTVAKKLRDYFTDYFAAYLASRGFTNCDMTLCQLAEAVAEYMPIAQCPTFIKETGNSSEVSTISGADIDAGMANSIRCRVNISNAANAPIINPVFILTYTVNNQNTITNFQAQGPDEAGYYWADIDMTADVPAEATYADVNFKANTRCSNNGTDIVTTLEASEPARIR